MTIVKMMRLHDSNERYKKVRVINFVTLEIQLIYGLVTSTV
jgi:hypothetical protein